MGRYTLQVLELNSWFEAWRPPQILEWALSKFHPNIAVASSFGAEDMVLIDMVRKINPDARVFTVETGRLHQETYNLMERVRERYGEIEVYYPDTEQLEAMVREYDVNLFYKSIELRKLCCRIRKVEPLKRVLSGLDAWITGLRSQQSVTRVDTEKLEEDLVHGGILKVNPLADFTEEDVWRYIRENNVPYNELHDRGYPSIGCEPCTRPIRPGEDIRAGRWWWEPRDKTECGLHCKIECPDLRETGLLRTE